MKLSSHSSHPIVIYIYVICILLQVCALVRCAGSDATSCGQGVELAESKFDFRLEGKFDTKYVYPSILTNKMGLEHPKHLIKTEDGRVTMKHSDMSSGLVTACLYGRLYERDDELSALE